ncbi:MAG TPA: class I SAM-dependent methyltransferase [Candidatus Tectomicrobia bacterium]
MTERQLIGQRAQEFCDDLWQRGDFWNFEGSEYERARCECLMAILDGYRYARALEIGCGAGYFTRLLTRLADQVVAFDIAPAAIARARILGADLSTVDFRVANAMDYEWRAEGPWDLVVFSDTICYLGWLYTFFDIAWLAAELFAATRPGGRLLLSNTMDPVYDKLLLPHIIRTYRDLFLNVGYRLETEEIFRGTKNGVAFEILISLLAKAPEEAMADSVS